MNLQHDTAFSRDQIEILLLEGVHETAIQAFRAAGYTRIIQHSGSLDSHDLQKKIATARILGIRSRTQLTADLLNVASRLLCVGCFCIGTNQVDTDHAASLGIPVFNAPYANTRSVAEWTIGCLISLKRRIQPRSFAAHRGEWQKSARDSYEVRGKTLGIVGYGNIGQQVSILAEALGMQVIYYDPLSRLPLGNARPVPSLQDLLTRSDAISLHVPETEQTKNMISTPELQQMKSGAYLLNAARGSVVDIDALKIALDSGHLSGAACDVFPHEPKSADDTFTSPLRGMEQVILTPHIGGSTQEAQAQIGISAAESLIQFCDTGATTGAVNFPQVSLPPQDHQTHRILHIHHNVPGVLSSINEVMARQNVNISGQYLQTDSSIGYVVIDIDHTSSYDPSALEASLRGITGTIRTRMLF